MLAAVNGHLAVVQYLHSQGASLTDKSRVSINYDFNYSTDSDLCAYICYILQYGRTPLMEAAKGGHLEVVQYLRTQGAPLTDTDGVSKYINYEYN